MSGYLVCLVHRVYLVCFVDLADLVYPVNLVQPNKQDKRNKPNRTSPTERIRGLRDRPAAHFVMIESKVNGHARSMSCQAKFWCSSFY
jgi:hypothetical protein